MILLFFKFDLIVKNEVHIDKNVYRIILQKMKDVIQL